MEINARSKLLDILKAYPELEEQIIKIAPPFQNLKNPVLRRTVGKLATLEKVAQIGGLDVNQLVNTLRRAVGQGDLDAEPSPPPLSEIPRQADDPAWISGEPQYIVNGSELLQRGEVPLVHVNQLLPRLETGLYLLVVTDFEPLPMIEAMQKQNRKVFHKVVDGNQHLTFIQ